MVLRGAVVTWMDPFLEYFSASPVEFSPSRRPPLGLRAGFDLWSTVVTFAPLRLRIPFLTPTHSLGTCFSLGTDLQLYLPYVPHFQCCVFYSHLGFRTSPASTFLYGDSSDREAACPSALYAGSFGADVQSHCAPWLSSIPTLVCLPPAFYGPSLCCLGDCCPC